MLPKKFEAKALVSKSKNASKVVKRSKKCLINFEKSSNDNATCEILFKNNQKVLVILFVKLLRVFLYYVI